MRNVREGLYRVVKNVATPLHFFAIVAIILGAIICSLSFSNLPPDLTTSLIKNTFIVLIILIAVVGFLIIFFPKKLIFDKEAHLTVLREKLGDSEFPVPYEAGDHPPISASKFLKIGRTKP